MRAFLASLCGLLACASAARANWEFARWGMSVEELRTSAPVRVTVARNDERSFKRVTRESSVLAYVARYEWREQVFEVRFGFDRHAKLNGVFLLTGGDRFDALAASLAATHGEPVSRADSPMPCRLWLDPARTDYIRLRRTGAAVIEQRPVRDGTAMGCEGAGRRPAGAGSGTESLAAATPRRPRAGR